MLIEPASRIQPAGTVLPPNDTCEALARRLRAETQGEVLFDAGSRGRYATDASIYQITPVGAFVPRTERDIATAIDVARELKVPVLARGGGTSQCGQTTGAALVIDNSKHFRRVLDLDLEAGTATVEPGLVLDHLNAQLKPHGLWYPVDVSTSAQATLGRHGRQQLLRLALHRLRQHGAQRARRERLAVERRAGGLRARGHAGRARRGHRAVRARPRAPAPRGDRGELAQGDAPRGRLQPRHLRQPEREALHDRRQREPRAPADRRRGHAGLHAQPHAQAGAAAARQGAGHRQLPDLPCGHGCRAAHRQARTHRGRAGRPHDDRAEPREPGLQAHGADRADRQAGRDPAGGVLGRREGAAAAGAGTTGRIDGRPGPAGQRGRDARRGAPEEPLGGAQGRPQHHDEPQGRRQAGELHRGLRRAARAPGRVHRRADRGVRAPRLARHLVRACLGRHPACAADPRHARRWRRQDAIDRRGGLGAGAQVQGRLQRRARRRPVPRRMDRVAVRASDQRGLPRDQAQARSRRPVQPRQDHRSASHGRRRAVPLRATDRAQALSPHRTQAGARLVGLERECRPGDRADLRARHRRRQHRRPGQGGRDVQQQRPLPQVRRRHHVPELPRHARRAAPHARPRQHAAAGAVGPARPRCLHRRGPARDHGPVRGLQGLQARLPDRRGHGEDEESSSWPTTSGAMATRSRTGWWRSCPTTRTARAGCRGS